SARWAMITPVEATSGRKCVETMRTRSAPPPAPSPPARPGAPPSPPAPRPCVAPAPTAAAPREEASHPRLVAARDGRRVVPPPGAGHPPAHEAAPPCLAPPAPPRGPLEAVGPGDVLGARARAVQAEVGRDPAQHAGGVVEHLLV